MTWSRTVLIVGYVLMAISCYSQKTEAEGVSALVVWGAVQQIYPGYHLEQDDELLVSNDGSKRDVEIVGLCARKSRRGWFVLFGLSFPEDRNVISAAIAPRNNLGSAAKVPSRLIAAYTDPVGRIAEVKKIDLDPASSLSDLVDVSCPKVSEDGSWPSITIISSSFYVSNSWSASVNWVTKVDLATLEIIERVPLQLKKIEFKQESEEIFKVDRSLAKRELRISGEISGTNFSYPCTDRCVVEGPKLLTLWRASAGTESAISAQRNYTIVQDAQRDLDNTKADQLTRAGMRAFELQEYEVAVFLLRQAAGLTSQARAWNYIGLALMKLGRNKEALDAFVNERSISPRNDMALNNIGIVEERMGDFEAAEYSFRMQLEIDPSNAVAHKLLGVLYAIQKKFPDAITQLENARSQKLDDWLTRFALGLAYSHTGKEEGQVLLEDGIKNAPAGALANSFPYADLLQSDKDPDSALEAAEKSIELLSGNLDMLDVSTKEVTLVDMDRVANLGIAWAQKGVAHFRKGDLDSAEIYLRAAWELVGSSAIADQLARVYEKGGKKDKAIDFYSYALNLECPYPPSRALLSTLVERESKINELINAATVDLIERRRVRLGRVGKKGSAEFVLQFSNGKQSPKVRFASGDPQLSAASKALERASYRVEFPNDLPAKILRTAVLTCSAEACYVELWPQRLSSLADNEVVAKISFEQMDGMPSTYFKP